MTNGQIRSFIAVVEERSYGRAAGALYISQPAVSKSVSKLEEELGFPLLERVGGALQPTTAGKLLYDFFTRVDSEYRSLIAEVQRQLAEPSGLLRLGCPETWNPAVFYDRIVNHFAEKLPGLRLSVECCRLPDLLARLHSGKLDLIMTHEFYPPVQYGLLARRLTDTGCGILYSNAYFQELHSLADLRGVDFLVFDSDLEKKFGNLIRRICGEYGFVPNVKNCGQFSSALFSMSCGKGVMLFTDWDNAINNSAYSYLPLAHRSPVNLIYPAAAANPNVALFADELAGLFA